MLTLFRKYQKFVFLIVTVFVVSSVVFFGTYQAFGPTKQVKDETVFQTNGGRKISQLYLQDFQRFLALEPLSVRSFGNILNDQIITKDFIETELAYLLIKGAKDKIGEDFDKRHQKEKHFRPYKHPMAAEISAENVWMTFAPQLKDELSRLSKMSEGNTEEAVACRLNLFLMERRFPGELLSYILRYQEKEVAELPKDPRLAEGNLALFGYKDLNDWFGPAFLEQVTHAIIKGADFAREQGYKISKEEIAAEIVTRREKAFQFYKNHWDNSYSLYQDCLKLLQMDELRVAMILEDVLLFRRLLSDVADVNFVDTYAFKKFYSKAHECIEAEVCHLPSELYFKTEGDLKKFEAYLHFVAGGRDNLLSVPEKFESIDSIKKRARNLIATEYDLEMVRVSKKELEAKVSVKATWDWEEKNKDLFAELKDYETLGKEQRLAVDSFARAKIVEAHPEWIDFALKNKAKEDKKFVLAKGSKKSQLEGITNVDALCDILDKGDVASFTQDEKNYYAFKVKKKTDVLLSFKEALEEGILDELLKEGHPNDFEKILVAIFEDAKTLGLVAADTSMDAVKDKLPSLRFCYHLKNENHEKAMWPSIKKREKIFRESGGLLTFDQAKASDKKVFFSEELGPFVFTVIDHRVENPLPIEKMQQEEKLVSDEIKRHLLEKILGHSTP